MRLGVDFDDVVCDMLGPLLDRHNAERGTNWTTGDLTQWECWKDVALSSDAFWAKYTPDLYLEAKPIPGAIEALRELRDAGHALVFVSNCWSSEFAAQKMKWLERHLGGHYEFMPVGPHFPVKEKADTFRYPYDVDWLVDDHIQNVESFPGYSLLVSRPHNRQHICRRKRIKGLGDLVTLLKHQNQTLNKPAGPLTGAMPPLSGFITVPGEPLDPKIASEKPTNPKDAIGSNKLPLHLWPNTATMYGCLGMLEGALKYGRSNFRAIGVRSSIYYDAARRHLDAWFEGEDNAPDSGLPHLAHALACIAIILDAGAAGKLNDDRMYPGGYVQVKDELTPHVQRLKEKYADKAPKHYTSQDAA